MIHVSFEVDSNDYFLAFTIEGHAEFDEPGKDLVCAAISAIGFGAANSLLLLTDCELTIDTDDGYMDVRPLCNDSKTQLLVKGLEVSLRTVEDEYKDYVHISKIVR